MYQWFKSATLKKILFIYALSLMAFFILRIALLISYPDYFSGLSASQIINALIVGLRFDFSIITVLNSIIILALLIPLRICRSSVWQSFWLALALLPLLLTTSLGIASLVYFGEVNRHLSTELLFMLDDWQIALDLMLSSRLEFFLATIACLLVIVGIWFYVIRYHLKKVPQLPYHTVRAWLLLAVMLPLLLIAGRGFIIDGKTINVVDAYALGSPELANLALNAAFSVIHTSRNIDEPIAPALTPEETNALSSEINFDTQHPFLRQYNDMYDNNQNIVVILLESWGNEYIDTLGTRQLGITPNMDRLMEESLVFTQHYAAAQRSIQSLQAILTGVPVFPGQLRLSEGLERANMSRIGSLAATEGYQSLFVQSSARRSFRMDSVTASLGFQHYYGQEDIPLLLDYPQAAPRFGWDYDTLMFFESHLDQLSESGKPFLGFAYTGTTHEPFADPGERFRRFPHTPTGETGYLNTLAYSDWALGQFFERAKESDWYENTLFIITSDHVLRTEGKSLQTNFKVPLLIHAPGLIEGGVSNKVVSHYDIFPTLLDLMGVNQQFSAFGESILRDEYTDEAWVNQGELTGIISADGELLFTSRTLELLETKDLSKESLKWSWARAQLLSHLSIQMLLDNTWLSGHRETPNNPITQR